MFHGMHISMLVENNYLVWFEYVDFHILINPLPANTDIGECVSGNIFVRNTSSRWGNNGPDAPQNAEYYVFFYFQHNSSRRVDPALPCTAWEFSCDLLKSVCGTNGLYRKMNWRIWAIQTYML